MGEPLATAPVDGCPECCERNHPWRSWIKDPKPPTGQIIYLRAVMGDYQCSSCGAEWTTGWAVDFL